MRTLRWVFVVALGAGSVLFIAAPHAEAAGKNCSDFTNQQAAQAFYKADTSDPDGLDGPIGPNNDSTGTVGVACESLPCPCDKTPVLYSTAAAQTATTVATTVATTPVTVAGTTATTVAAFGKTGAFSLRLFVIGLGVLLVGAYFAWVTAGKPVRIGANPNPRSPTDW